MTNGKSACVIRVGDRFFRKFGARERALTAWSLAGARIFAPWREEIDRVCQRLRKKGILPVVVKVVLESPTPARLPLEIGR